jgi:hypothetical protein
MQYICFKTLLGWLKKVVFLVLGQGKILYGTSFSGGGRCLVTKIVVFGSGSTKLCTSPVIKFSMVEEAWLNLPVPFFHSKSWNVIRADMVGKIGRSTLTGKPEKLV